MPHDDLPEFRLDPQRPGIIRFDDDPTAGILVGIKSAEVVRRCNAFPALLAAVLQYRDDMLHPNIADDSRKRRLKMIEAAIAAAE